MTSVVSIRLDDDVAHAVKALGRGSAGGYLRTLLVRDLRQRRLRCGHARSYKGRCADCGTRLRGCGDQ